MAHLNIIVATEAVAHPHKVHSDWSLWISRLIPHQGTTHTSPQSCGLCSLENMPWRWPCLCVFSSTAPDHRRPVSAHGGCQRAGGERHCPGDQERRPQPDPVHPQRVRYIGAWLSSGGLRYKGLPSLQQSNLDSLIFLVPYKSSTSLFLTCFPPLVVYLSWTSCPASRQVATTSSPLLWPETADW